MKCPYSVENKTPTPDNLHYLKTVDGKVSVNRKHKLVFCPNPRSHDIKKEMIPFRYIHLKNDQYLEKIVFDQSYWEKLQSNLINILLCTLYGTQTSRKSKLDI